MDAQGEGRALGQRLEGEGGIVRHDHDLLEPGGGRLGESAQGPSQRVPVAAVEEEEPDARKRVPQLLAPPLDRLDGVHDPPLFAVRIGHGHLGRRGEKPPIDR
jgi:hypothetical protein